MITCLRCAKCCVIYNFIKMKWIDCPYLDRKTKLCKIYKKRLGKYLGFGFVCDKRINLTYNYPDCPYNKPNLELHPHYR